MTPVSIQKEERGRRGKETQCVVARRSSPPSGIQKEDYDKRNKLYNSG